MYIWIIVPKMMDIIPQNDINQEHGIYSCWTKLVSCKSINVVGYHSNKTTPHPDPDDAQPLEGVLEWSSLPSKLEHCDVAVDNNKSCDQPYNEESFENELISDNRDIGVVTELCNSANLPEVEILSLIEEQIPKYRLRADSITDFCGYDNEDWIQTPLIPIDEDLELSTEQITETLKYFILCSERVTQMTRTYNDIEAVNRLLEEKERDLELAAKIGQTLLQKNQDLSDKNDVLEEQLTHATEKVKQLKHELVLKDGLLQAFAHYESTDTDSNGSPCDAENAGASVLHKKVKLLEDENLQLKLETAQLSAETSDYEEKEAKLVTDCLEQLGDVKQQLEFYREELMKKTEESCSQKEEITGLLAQIVDLQKKSKVLTLENLDLQKHLEASQDSQRALTKEIAELKDKYDELCELLEENQEEMRRLRSKQKPHAVKHNYLTSSLLSVRSDSIASELESSLRGEIEYPPGYSPADRKVQNWKIFETVKAAKKASSQPPSRRSYSSNASLCSSLYVPGYSPPSNISRNHSGESTTNPSNRSSVYLSDGESVASEGYYGDLDSLYGSHKTLGRPGIPGSNDLETALRRISLRRANELNEQDYFSEEEERRRKRTETESSTTPGACRTPDSTLSTGSGLSAFSHMTGNNPYYRLPEKLKIVKPIEGSLTLRHWQQLATPHIGGIFESRPGVQIKGERKLDLEEEVYNISDIEEDDDQDFIAPKRYEESSTINTFTNSLVKHPYESISDDDLFDQADDEFSDTSSIPQMSTPRLATAMHNRNQGTSTYSMSLGLASILNERDLTPTVSENPGTHKAMTSNPARFPSILSDKHFDLSKNRSAIQTTASSNSVTMTTTVFSSANKDSQHQTNTENSNLFDKIKHTGFSLYGYLGNWGQKTQTTTSFTSSVSMTTVSNSETMTTSALNGPQVSDLVTVGTTVDSGEATSSKSSGLGSILGTGPKSHVLGALTSMKQSGIF